MKKELHQKIIETIRARTPVSLRQKIGPLLAQGYYLHRKYVNPEKKPKVLSVEQTVDYILKNQVSVIRFGDGEITLIDGHDLPFQKWDKTLAEKLEHILCVKDDQLLICIPGMWENLDVFVPYAHHFVKHHLYRYNHIWAKILSYETVYGDTSVTRHYLGYNDKSRAGEIFKKIFTIWEGREVVLIEGAKSRLGVGNNLFDNTKSLKRILCPPENAFSQYEAIKKEAEKVGKEKLILLSLGPTAKVLAYDLYMQGYRVVDIGHIDMEYEMFLRKEVKQVKVPHKYFNEINERDPIDCNDEKYLQQILVTIS